MELSYISLVGVLNSVDTLESSLIISYEVKHRPITKTSHSIPENLPNKNESICPHKFLYTNINNHFIFNSQNMQTTQMSINCGQLSISNVTLKYKGMNHWYMWCHEWFSKELCQVEETRQKQVYTVWRHLNKTLESVN